jgi:uncharacterized protein (UPF0548 family)
MFQIRRPTDRQLDQFCTRQTDAPHWALTSSVLPPCPAGYRPNHGSGVIGAGEGDFQAACEALREWRMFPEWLRVWPRRPELATGELAAAVVRLMGVWAANVCRIVEVTDDPRRFGFVYATLAEHAALGAERFLVEWTETGDVVFSIDSVSRPRHVLAWLTLPYFRSLQKTFVRDTLDSMRRAVMERRRASIGEALPG